MQGSRADSGKGSHAGWSHTAVVRVEGLHTHHLSAAVNRGAPGYLLAQEISPRPVGTPVPYICLASGAGKEPAKAASQGACEGAEAVVFIESGVCCTHSGVSAGTSRLDPSLASAGRRYGALPCRALGLGSQGLLQLPCAQCHDVCDWQVLGFKGPDQ